MQKKTTLPELERCKRKRPHSSQRDEAENPLQCKICLQMFSEPYNTACGHTFCRTCIVRSVQFNPQCPICDTNLDLKKPKTICPNFTVATLIEQVKMNEKESQTTVMSAEEGAPCTRILQMIHAYPFDIDSMRRISAAVQRRQLEMELNEQQINNLLLHDFLERMIEKRENSIKKIQTELELLKQDKQKILNTLSGQLSPESIQHLVPDTSLQSFSQPHNNTSREAVSLSNENKTDTFFAPGSFLSEQLIRYRRRMTRHISSLESAYFGRSCVNNHFRESNFSVGSVPKFELEDFSEIMHSMYQYEGMKLLTTLNYNLETNNALSIVSSIKFDKDDEFFVIAGVTKKIKLYNYESVLNFEGEFHYPVEQLICNSKISNISWNPYIKNMLASSDYDGTVQLWDTAAAKGTRTFKEHEKRCWTVQFNNVDPHLMASGSDDGRVKLWCVNSPQSVGTIDARVNVCAVYFSPKNRNQLVFGSSDHCVHLYDIRQINKPINVFRGHRKAVSYVKYCNENEVISASTDSSLKLWDVNTGKCLQTMRGHHNEKNFVGLATNGTHVVCGSENNRLYLYYKMVPDPLLSFDCALRSVDSPSISADQSRADYPLIGSSNATAPNTGSMEHASNGTNDFVSAVCWKKNSNVILAANSQGQTFILQLQ